jgi:preprotein translocase subunit SecA
VSEANDEWDLEGLVNEITTFWPTTLTVDELDKCRTTDELYEVLMGEATGYYEKREEELGAGMMRELERQVMLNIIDTQWREHLLEMDYLEEGINLRAMGQRDPLVEWQREGFEMFGAMMHSVSQDFVRYIMHVQVVAEEQPVNQVTDMALSGPADPSEGGDQMRAAARAEALAEGGATDGEVAAAEVEEAINVPVVKSDWDKTPRNAPCPCGSGKKFKNCHGAA